MIGGRELRARSTHDGLHVSFGETREKPAPDRGRYRGAVRRAGERRASLADALAAQGIRAARDRRRRRGGRARRETRDRSGRAAGGRVSRAHLRGLPADAHGQAMRMVFATILFGLVPSFLMVALAGSAPRTAVGQRLAGLDRLNFEILFPALIFVAASARPMALADVVRIGPAVWAILVGRARARLADRAASDRRGFWTSPAPGRRPGGSTPRSASSRWRPCHAAMPRNLAVAVGLAIPVANVFAVSAPVARRRAGAWRRRCCGSRSTRFCWPRVVRGDRRAERPGNSPPRFWRRDRDAGSGGDPGGADVDRGDDELAGAGAAGPVCSESCARSGWRSCRD